MGYGANLFGATSTFGATSFDIGSDLINSLDFLGYNASHIILNNLLNQFYSSKEDHNLTCTDTFNGTTIAESAEKVEIHQIWGILGILIMFLPGIASILPFLFSTIKRGRNLHTIVIVIAMVNNNNNKSHFLSNLYLYYIKLLNPITIIRVL